MKIPLAGIACALVLLACGKEPQVTSEPEGNTDALVTVNGHQITQFDLSVATEKLLSRANAQMFTEEIEKNALESMVMMMVIAQEAEKTLSAEEVSEIRSKVERYKEEMLVQKYLRNYADVTPPSEQELLAYYEKNKAFFGEVSVREFQFVGPKTKPAQSAIAEMLSQLSKVKTLNDWRSSESEIKKLDSSFELIFGSTDVPNLDPDLLRVVEALSEGETSAVVFLKKVPHLVRVNKVLQKNAKPFSEVKDSIRKTLSAEKLKNHIKTISAELIGKGEVSYVGK